ncbi:restriction endonuclease subunit S [Arenibacterium sp. LLYu02]|uniref:restriction endonuclease subunit S n=1 Tax=Arenibacterium sp. LLYu02 TaxID=3404132 RepID=UPI003B2192AC
MSKLSPTRFKAFLRERNEFSKDGSETLLSVSEYFGVKPRAEAFDDDRQESRADSLVGYRLVTKGDLVMNYMLAWRGAYGVSDYDGIVSPAYSVFKVDRGKIESRFLHHRSRSRDMQAIFKQNSRGIMESRLRLYPENLLSIGFDLPPRNDQVSILVFLDRETGRIDGLIEKKTRFIALLKEKRAAVITYAVTKGIDPDAPMKDSGVDWLGRVPAHWDVVPPTALFTESKERAREGDQMLSATQKYGVIPLAEYEALEQRQVTMAVVNLNMRKHVEVGDFVISMRSMDGGLERARAVGSVRSSYSVLKPGAEVEGRFYGALMKSSLYIQALRLTSNFIRDGQDLNFGHVRKVKLPKPDLREQAAIADHIEAETARIDGLITLTERSIDLLREKRSALITAAVTGKIDVRAAA